MKLHKNMNNQEIAKLLKAVSAAYEIKDEKKYRFQIIAYDRAAATIDHAVSEVKDLWDGGRLESLPGIGKSLAAYLDELFRTGKVNHLQNLLKNLPEAMFELLEIPGIGPKTAFKLCQELNLQKGKNAVGKLEKAALKGKIRVITGFGLQSEKAILEGIEEYQQRQGRMLLSSALELTEAIIEYLKANQAVLEVYPLGSLRRCCSTIGDIDIAVATEKTKEVIEHFVKYPQIKKIISQGPRKASILLSNNQQIDLRVQKKDSFGAMLQYFTGSKMHNIHLREIAQKKGLSLSEYGTRKLKAQNAKRKATAQKLKLKKFKDEESFYNYLGMDWIPPELREDKGEIEAAQAHKLPKLVKINDIKGDLHTHSNFIYQESSHDKGENSFKEIIEKAISLGYEYLGLSDHSPSVSQHTSKQIISLLSKRKNKIEEIIKSNKFTQKSFRENGREIKILNTLEVDILADGRLSVPEKGLAMLDFACASIHSSMKQPRKTMTKRVLIGLSHPKVKFLAHPSGRMLNQRQGYELDWEKIFAFCLENNKWLEINSWPKRLDLPDVLVAEAVKKGVKLVINTDAHEISEMDLMKYGVFVARRGWAEKKDIINALSWQKLRGII